MNMQQIGFKSSFEQLFIRRLKNQSIASQQGEALGRIADLRHSERLHDALPICGRISNLTIDQSYMTDG